MPGTGTNRHDLYTMDNSRSKDTILSRAKDVVESDKLQESDYGRFKGYSS